jgi:hypothetical protein
MFRLHETAIMRLHVSGTLFIFLKREAGTFSFLYYYNKVSCVWSAFLTVIYCINTTGMTHIKSGMD